MHSLKLFKKVAVCVFVLLLTLAPAFNTCATTFQPRYADWSATYEITSHRDGENVEYSCTNVGILASPLTIDNIEFHNHSDNTTKAIGITGTVINNTSKNIFFILENDYYDVNGNKILSTDNIHLAPANKTVKFVDMQNNTDFQVTNFEDGGYDIVIPTRIDIEVVAPLYAEDILSTSYASSRYTGSDYVYDRYDVEVEVGEDESIKVSEDALAFFNSKKHGIIRHLPTVWETNTINQRRRTRITDINVNDNFEIDNNYADKQLDIKIGDENVYVEGLKNYQIDYTYHLDKEDESRFDEFYFNLLEDSHTVSNLSFTIAMPKDFDISRIGFSDGQVRNSVIYYVEDNTIHGFYDGIINNKAVTVRIALDDGYYNNPGLPSPEMGSSIAIVPFILIVLLIVVISLWYYYGRDEKHISAIEFYPPDGMNPLEMQFYYKGEVDSEGVVSLLTYLASKGYLKIVEEGGSCTIVKVKDYDGKNDEEERFMEALFKDGRTEVTTKSLRNSFYRTIDKIVLTNNDRTEKQRIFEEIPTIVRVGSVLCAIATFLIPLVSLSFDIQNINLVICAAILTGLGLFYTPFYAMAIKTKSIFTLIFILIHSSVFVISITWTFDIVYIFSDIHPIYLITVICSMVFVLIELICIVNLPKRNQYGAQMLARIEGFRNFLMTAERARLEMLVHEDPNYFYSIIPYTYVLGVSKKWMRQFEDIAIGPRPDWYVSDKSFSYRTFRTFMDKSVTSISNSMISSPSRTSTGRSSGGSSGGGSSGGGGGGGGSSSW